GVQTCALPILRPGLPPPLDVHDSRESGRGDLMIKPALSKNNASSVPTSVTREPFPASRKVYRPGTLHPSVRVAMREIDLSPTRGGSRDAAPTPNAPVTVYDTSGPFTDPSIEIDVRKGLPPLRQDWILARGDVEQMDGPSSAYGLDRLADGRLDAVRFPNLRRP